MEHTLKIKSLFDGQAICSCGGWTFAATGQTEREHIESEFAMHKQFMAAREVVSQGWLEGELPLAPETAHEYVERIGAHIYQDFQRGLWTFKECEVAIESLNVFDDLWLGMPEGDRSDNQTSKA